jgi:hypothetical protein
MNEISLKNTENNLQLSIKFAPKSAAFRMFVFTLDIRLFKVSGLTSDNFFQTTQSKIGTISSERRQYFYINIIKN